MEKNMEKVCITESLGCTVENNTALYIKETSGKKKKKERGEGGAKRSRLD